MGAAPFALSGTERKYERSRPFAMRHLLLDLELLPAQKAVNGAATLDFERVAPDVDSLALDAVGFELDRVRLDAGHGLLPVAYEYDGEQITLAIPKQLDRGKVEVVYRARPRRGMYFLEPDEHVRDRPTQIWTQCQDEDARHFVPCHDKPHVKLTTELIVRAPAGWRVLSNGELLSTEQPRGKKKPWTWHYRMDQPHASYLFTLVAGDLEVVPDRLAEGRVPIAYWVPPGRSADARRSFGETPRMVELFGRLTGVPYPWSRYTQVVVSDFIFGGMENTTATTMYEYVLLDERAGLDATSNDIVAHELAHQWFGDYVTCRDWSHGWLNEGFATFFEHVEREDRLGRDEYDYGVSGDLEAYLGEAHGRYQRAIVCRDYHEPIDLFDRHLYEKGGLVLHMLRRELGDELFWRGIRLYLERHAHGIVETSDLQRALEEPSGRSLERFFDQWVYRPGHPVLKVKVAWEDGLLSVSVRQTQKTGDAAVFAFQLEIEVGSKDGSTQRHKKLVETASDVLVVALVARPAWVGFDPDFRVAADVTLEAPLDMLRKQLSDAPSARLRWTAAEALGKKDDPPTIRALGDALGKLSHAWMVRGEAARALGKIRSQEAFAVLARHARVDHPKVRRAIAWALGNFRTGEAAKLLARMAREDRSYLVGAEAAHALGRTRDPTALRTLLSVVDRPSWADVTRAGVLDGLAALRDEQAVPEVMERTRYGVPARGRRAAIGALARLSDGKLVREHLEDLLDDTDPHLRIEVVRALEKLGDSRSRGALHRRLARELDGRVARRLREALRDIGEAGSVERARMNDEIETLRGKLSEVEARMSKLETKKKPKKREKEAKKGARS